MVAGADDTVPVWRLTDDLRAGTTLGADALEPVDVRLSDEVRDHYVSADTVRPDGLIVTRDLRAGELLATADLTDDPAPLVELPLLVPASGLPGDLRVGDLVDVWVSGAPDRPGRSTRLLEGARVTTVSADDLAGVGADRAVTVAFPPTGDVAAALEQLGRGTVVLLRVGG